MGDTVPTVKVKHPDVEGGFMIINESEFDAKVHEPFEGGSNETIQTKLKHVSGGRYKVLAGDAALKYPDGHEKEGEEVVFASKDEAQAALDAFLASLADAAGELVQ